MALNPPLTSNPFSLGRVTVTTPGTPVRILNNFPTYYGQPNDSGGNLIANGLSITALPGNAGLVYIGTATMNKANGVGVLATLAAGQSTQFNTQVGLNTFQVGSYYVDAATATDGVSSIAYVV